MFVEGAPRLSKEELERQLREQAAHVDAALCRLTELAAECEERLNWGGDGVTFARWLAYQCSLLPSAAREHERIGKRLAELPLIRGAFSRGELSYAKVGALIRVAEPATEEGCWSSRRRSPPRSCRVVCRRTGGSRRRRLRRTTSASF